MPSPNKLISLCLLFIALLMICLPPTAFCEKKSEAIGTTAEVTDTTGVLSIGPDGNVYIQFTNRHTKLTAGDFILDAIAETELTQTQSDQHEFMQAVWNVYNAWLKCEEAKKKFANGKMTKVQTEFECTRYDLLNSTEVSIWATAILNNNMGSEIELAAPLSEISKLNIEQDKQKLSDLIDRGAELTFYAYGPPDFTADVIPLNTSDPIIVSDKLVIDSVPIRDAAGASLFNPNR